MSTWELCSLLCRARCDARLVASALAFAPPPPSYTVEVDPPRWVVSPDDEDDDDSSSSVLPYEHTHIAVVTTSDGVPIPLFVLRYPGAHFTLLYSHGNATDAGLMRDVAIDLALNARVNVALYDYPGYGPTSRAVLPSERGSYDAIHAVYSHLLMQPWCTSPDQIVLYGQSVGSGPTVYLATRLPVAGVILHSPFMSGLRVLTPRRTCLSCCDVYDNLSRMHRLKAAVGVLIMHGVRDVEVPFHHSAALFDALPHRYQRGTCPWFPDAGHNDILALHREEYFIRLRAFLTRMMPGACVYAREEIIPGTRMELRAAAQRVWRAYEEGTPFPEAPGVRVVTSAGLTAPRAYVAQAVGVGSPGDSKDGTEGEAEALPPAPPVSTPRVSLDGIAVDVPTGQPVEEWAPQFSAGARLDSSARSINLKATRPTGPNPRPSLRTLGRATSGSIAAAGDVTTVRASGSGEGAVAHAPATAALACYASSSIKLPPVS